MTKEQEEKREKAIQNIADLLRVSPFSIEYKVKKRPQGIKIIFEVTQEDMKALIEKAVNKEK
jgi:hypothetical protein